MARRARIAIIDDEVDLSEALAEYLTDLGYEVERAASIPEFERLLRKSSFDLLILDLNLPGESGLDFLSRSQHLHDLPVIILSANTDPVERILGLELGAADFVVKPAEPQELAARAGNLLQRQGRARRDVLRLERATVDMTASRLLLVGRPPERLGAGEVMLVRAFAARPHQVLTRDELMDLAPAESLDVNDRSIDTRIARLRRKLDTDSIVTVRGRGYMFVPPGEPPP